MNNILRFVGCLCLVALLAMTMGCGDNKGLRRVAVGFANSSASWQRNGETIRNTLQAEGYVVDLAFADSADEQKKQLAEMIDTEPGCLVIGAVDSTALKDTLREAKEKNIPVIAYDRLVMDTDAVSYYASWDNEAVGEAMGQYIEAKLNLKSGAGGYNIEIFAGDPADNNAHLFYDGAMKILRPYIDNGQLICPTLETSFEQTATKDWNPQNAKQRMTRIYNDHYSEGAPLDAVLAPNDNVANAIITALDEAGYAQGTPLITGQDGDATAITNIKAGKQTFTIYKNPADLAGKCVRMIKAVVEGTQPDINDVTTYNNGQIVVPAYLCVPFIVDENNLDMIKP